jgi:small subunit ribosomal protein S8
MSVDSIGNFLTIIRNGVKISRPFVIAPYSKMNIAIARILQEEGFIRNIEEIEEDGKKQLKVGLKYVGGESVIHDIKRISKLSRRKYAGVNEMRPVIGGLGISILSTNQGVISQKQAKKLGVGGEIICTVW